MTASMAHSGATCQMPHVEPHRPPAVAVVEWAGAVWRELCKPCLDDALDWSDDGAHVIQYDDQGRPAQKLGLGEPTYLAWIFDPRRLYCGIHQWPAELCAGWVHNGRSRPDREGP